MMSGNVELHQLIVTLEVDTIQHGQNEANMGLFVLETRIDSVVAA
jgi:hypothetical protein